MTERPRVDRRWLRLFILLIGLGSPAGCVGPGLEPPARSRSGGDGDSVVFDNGGGAQAAGTGAQSGTGALGGLHGGGGTQAPALDGGVDDEDAGR